MAMMMTMRSFPAWMWWPDEFMRGISAVLLAVQVDTNLLLHAGLLGDEFAVGAHGASMACVQ